MNIVEGMPLSATSWKLYQHSGAKPYLLARTITVPRHSQVLCRIINPTDTSIRFYRRQPIAQLHEINEQDIIDLPEDFTDLDLHAPVVNHLSEAPPLQTEQQNVQQGSEQTTTASTPTPQPAQTKLQQLGITINNENLTAEENQKLRDLLEKNADIFATSMADLPGMIGFEHHIDTGDCPPIRRRAYSANPTLQREMTRQVTEMLNHGLIEESTAPWNSPAFLVKKKTGELRFVVDYRQLNKVVKPTFYPLPSMKDIQQTLGENPPKIFSALDLRQGFYQIPLSEESRQKSTFVTHDSSYKFRVMPMGLASSPQAFQRAMLTLFTGSHLQTSISLR